MGKKIKVVDIANEEPNIQEPEVSTEMIPDIEPEQVVFDDTPPTDVVNEEPIQKAKAKTRRRKKQTVETLELPTLEEEPVKEVEEPNRTPEVEAKGKVKKVIEQVKCPKCDKMMSQKSLRYTHEQNCKGEVVKTEDLPVKRRTTQKEVKAETNKKDIYNKIVGKNVNIEASEVQIPEEVKLEVFKSIQRQQERLKMKENNLNKLKMQFF